MSIQSSNPKVIIIAGPNGAGKSTAAPELLQGALAVSEFVNADVIARGLAAFDPESVSMQAGRIMLSRLDELAQERSSFAFETTLASRTFAHGITKLKLTGYLFHLVYLCYPARNSRSRVLNSAFSRRAITFQTILLGEDTCEASQTSLDFTDPWRQLKKCTIMRRIQGRS